MQHNKSAFRPGKIKFVEFNTGGKVVYPPKEHLNSFPTMQIENQ